MAYTVSGKVIAVLKEEHGNGATSQKPWRKRTFVVESFCREDDPNVTDRFRHKVVLDLWNDKIDAYIKYICREDELFDDVPPVTVQFEVEASKAGERWFSSNTAFSVREYTGEHDIRDIASDIAKNMSMRR